jgi:glycosyltransferase involved in cell wall biosynthesis
MKISIITVTYNSAKFLENCLRSIASQQHKNVEHIVIDGASTDETIKILNNKKKHIKKLISEPDKGIYDAMNKGIKLAQGDIIGILNSDDFYLNNKILSRVSKLFENNPSLDACYSDLIYVNQLDTSKIVRFWKSSKFIETSFLRGWCPPHPTLFVRRSVYKHFGVFNTNYKLASDTDLMFRFFEINKITNIYVPEIWVAMRLGGATNKNLKNIFLQNKEIISAFKKCGYKVNIVKFLIYKFFLKMKQFLNKPLNE